MRKRDKNKIMGETGESEAWLIGFYLGVGDIVCAHPWICALAEEHADVTVNVAIGRRAADAAGIMQWPQNVDFVLFELPRIEKFKAFSTFLSSTFRRRYDRVLNSPHPPVQAASWKLPLLLALLRLFRRVQYVEGGADDPFAWLYDKRYPVSRGLSFDARDRVFFQLAGLLPLDVARTPAFAQEISDDGAIGVHVGVSRANRLWPAKHFVTLCKMLLSAYPNRPVIVFGLPHEVAPLLDCGLPPQVTIFEGTFAQALERVARLGVMVSHDSGFMHIAAALGKPLVALFGASSVQAHLPSYGEAIAVQDIKLSCQPCDLKKCKYETNYCMHLLPPDRVFDAIRRQIELHSK